MNTIVANIVEKSLYFKNEVNSRMTCFTTRTPIDLNKETTAKNKDKHYKSTISNLFKKYGIIFGRIKRVREGKDLVYTYGITLKKILKDIADYKHDKAKKVDDYPLIFKEK